MKRFVVLILFFISKLVAQNETSKWVFGMNSGLDFSTTPPTNIPGTAIHASEGCASVADVSGNLLFYTSGDTVWNSAHQVMANGTGLYGHKSSTQSAIIVKQPGSSFVYFLFTQDGSNNTVPRGLCYSIIDMSLAAGLGSVTVKNTQLYNPCTEKLTGVRHCNGVDTWVVTKESNTNNFRSYLVTASGVNTAAVISVPASTSNPTVLAGYMKISPTGKRIGVVTKSNPQSFELFDFNNNTGAVSNPVTLITFTNVSSPAYGCEFSPDGTKFYATTGNKLMQWDLCAGSNSAIINSLFTYTTTCFAAQLAPNGKIYLEGGVPNFLDVIDNPNSLAPACNYSVASQSINGIGSLGLPNFVTSLIKSPFKYTSGSGCLTATFTAPAVASTSLMSCAAFGNTVTGQFWNFGEPSSGASNTSTLLNPIHAYSTFGFYNVTLIINYANCSPDTIKQSVIIGPVSTVVSATATCNGFGTATVNALGGSGLYSYNWIPSSQSNSVATNLSPGIYTVSVSDNINVCTNTQTFTVLAPIQVTGSVSQTLTCTGGNASVTVNGGSGNYNYLWSAGGYTTSTVNGLMPGSYTVIITDIYNTCSFTKTVQITPLSQPSITVTGNFSICVGETTTLTASGADSYLWSNGGTGSYIPLSPFATTVFTVTGTNSVTTCSSVKTVTLFVSKCLDFDEITSQLEIFKIYPNPVKDFICIEIDEEVLIRIYSPNGNLLIENSLQKGINKINISQLENSLYIMNLRYRTRSFNLKFFKN